MKYEDLSQEQHLFIDLALQGENILVDACIGSGREKLEVSHGKLSLGERALNLETC